MSGKKKVWTSEEIGILIEAYREHRNLWDPKNLDYKNRLKKRDSYKEISGLFDTSIEEVERKVKNIISQYQRERRNLKEMKKSGAGQNFKAKWFGYNAMSFLHDKNQPRKGIQIGGEYEESESSDEEIATQSISDIPSEGEGENSQLTDETSSASLRTIPMIQIEKTPNAPPIHSQQEINFTAPKVKTPKKNNKRLERISESSQVLQMMKSVYEKKERDEYDVFGEMIANNLRNLKSEYVRVSTQQQISNLLYNARMSQFQLNAQSFRPVPQASTSSQSSSTYCTSDNATMGSEQDGEQQVNILKTAFTSAFGNSDELNY